MAAPIIKKLFLRVATTDPVLAVLAPIRPRCASVFFMHRFALPDLGVEGHDPNALKRQLEYLRRHKYRLMSLPELLAHIGDGKPFPERAVLFTVDDGYEDFALVGGPVFAAYDCPVTVFLITDFVSQRLWNWFDKVPWIVTNTRLTALAIDIGGQPLQLRWESTPERSIVAERLVESMKRVRDPEKERLIAILASSLEVELPSITPARDRGMTWDDVRGCAARGATFGPHTVTHPILSQVDAERSDSEISESWRALTRETAATVPLFCYPNGTPLDFSAREEASVARAGMKGALSTVEASVASPPFGAPFDLFAIPRFPYPASDPAFVQIASGIEALRGRLQGR